MTDERFDELVAKLETKAKAHPKAYTFRVACLAVIGSSYLGAILVILTGLLIAGVFVAVESHHISFGLLQLGILLIVFIWMIIKAIWVKFAEPDGVEVRAEQCPELFAIIHDLQNDLGSPEFHRVLITEDFNAGVMQIPRLGLLGWYRNYLLIGLPLMKALSVEQFKSVLAHEFGHLAKGHGRISGWIYRSRLRWARLISTLSANRSLGSFLFKPFFARFAPYFEACSLPLARTQEFQADATAARLTSAAVTAESLTGVSVIGHYLNERFWPGVYKSADRDSRPTNHPYKTFGQDFAAAVDQAEVQTWISLALSERTATRDSHPALGERLSAIGQKPALVLPELGKHAGFLLGEELPEITTQLDQAWQKRVEQTWSDRYREAERYRRRLEDLNARERRGEKLNLKERLDQALLTETAGNSPEASLEKLQLLHSEAPEDNTVCFGLGLRLLAGNNNAGVELVTQSLNRDPNLTIPASNALRTFYARIGNSEQTLIWQRRLEEQVRIENLALNERSTLNIEDHFEAHNLPEATITDLTTRLRNIQHIHKVFLVRKTVRYLPERPFYIIGFSLHSMVVQYNRNAEQEAVQYIQDHITLPGQTMFISLTGNYRFEAKLQQVPNSKLI